MTLVSAPVPRAVDGPPRVAVLPVPVDHLAAAVEEAGGQVVDADAAEAVVWADPKGPGSLTEVLAAHPDIRWVQLPWAGVEPFVDVFDHDHVWTCGKGVYAEPVAEHALGMLLAGFRHLVGYAKATSWGPDIGRNLLGANVVILGGGEITRSLLRLLGPFGCDVTVVRRHQEPLEGATVVTAEALHRVLPDADALVVALALTDETRGIIDARRLRLLPEHAWVVNVARGEHVVTDDLVGALRDGTIGGAALDVTDPEPLPEGHPLWGFDNVLITPHTANTKAMGRALLRQRVVDNVRRFGAGEPLLGPVDPDLGY